MSSNPFFEERPTDFGGAGLVKTAKALGIDAPPIMLARVDEVIE